MYKLAPDYDGKILLYLRKPPQEPFQQRRQRWFATGVDKQHCECRWRFGAELLAFFPLVRRCGTDLQCIGCMHRRVFIKKTWLSAVSYAQSRISLVYPAPLVFLFLGLLPLQLNQIWRIFCVMWEGVKVGGLYLIVCKNTDMFECLFCYIQLW